MTSLFSTSVFVFPHPVFILSLLIVLISVTCSASPVPRYLQDSFSCRLCPVKRGDVFACNSLSVPHVYGCSVCLWNMALLSLKWLSVYIWVLTLSSVWTSLVFTTAVICSKTTRFLHFVPSDRTIIVFLCVCIKASLEHDIMLDWRGQGLLTHTVGGFALIIKNHFYWDLGASLVQQLNWDFIICCCCCWLFHVPTIWFMASINQIQHILFSQS